MQQQQQQRCTAAPLRRRRRRGDRVPPINQSAAGNRERAALRHRDNCVRHCTTHLNAAATHARITFAKGATLVEKPPISLRLMAA